MSALATQCFKGVFHTFVYCNKPETTFVLFYMKPSVVRSGMLQSIIIIFYIYYVADIERIFIMLLLDFNTSTVFVVTLYLLFKIISVYFFFMCAITWRGWTDLYIRYLIFLTLNTPLSQLRIIFWMDWFIHPVFLTLNTPFHNFA